MITLQTETRNGFERAHLDDLRLIWRGQINLIDMRFAGHDSASMPGRHHGISNHYDLLLAYMVTPERVRPLTEQRKREVEVGKARIDWGYRRLSKLGKY